MVINREVVEAFIIYAYKKEYFPLVEELLKVMYQFQAGEGVRVVKSLELPSDVKSSDRVLH